MEELNFFKFEDRDDLNAASLGISSIDWTCTSTKEFSENKDGVVDIMRRNRFDILPAQGKSSSFEFYIFTSNWGDFENVEIEQGKIDRNEDVIYYLTHVRDVLRLMQEKKRYFYFLSNHSKVIGLITISNFNDKQFYFWLYKKLVKLEKELSRFILCSNPSYKVLETVNQLSLQENDKEGYFSKVFYRFLEDKEKGSDADIFEYLYFRQLCELIIYFKLYPKLGLTKSDFESGLGKLNNIRNLVAHPSRSIVKSPDDLNSLWKGITKMDELIRLLRKQNEV